MITIGNVIEAMLFACDEPVSIKEFKQLFEREEFQELNFDETQLAEILTQLVEKYQDSTSCFEIKEIAGGYQFFTKPQYGEYVRIAVQTKEHKKLSKATLETLSIVAYKQPITKAEIEHIRGVNSDYALHKLLDKSLIQPAGRSELPGKPLLYQTTSDFLAYFGLKNIQDLPKLKEFLNDEEIPKQLFQPENIIPE